MLGFVQRFGVGIQMAQADLAENGNPPVEFKIDLTTIICTVREGERTRNIKVSDKLADKSESGAGAESELAKQILAIIAGNPLGKAKIAKQLGKSKPSRYLNELMVHLLQRGFVEYTIPGKPNSRLQKYRITAKGRVIVDSSKKS